MPFRTVIGQELAIFVRELEKQAQFYTMSGKWIHRSSQSAHFFVPHFIEPAELDDILPYLPTAGVSSKLRDKLQDFPTNVPRDLGKPLIRKMLDFWAKSDAAYQAASTILDNVHEHVAGVQKFGFATLEQIAEKVLPTQTKCEDGEFPDYVLYAVHRSLLRDDIGFRPQTKGTLRTGGKYEISPRNEVENIKNVCAMVRLHREQQAAIASGSRHLPRSRLEQFATAAQYLIDHSRQSRRFTPHGTIGPFEKLQESNDTTLSRVRDSMVKGPYAQFVAFFESWAAWSTFGYQSSLNGVGSEILRAIGRYGEVDLDPSTAWTFLQEIGAILPWENKISFDLRLGDINGKNQLGFPPKPDYNPTCIPELDDKLQKLRKDWGDLPIYCIDDIGAHEIDDGISIETTATAGEYWVHINAADPASHIHAQSKLCFYALAIVENIYLPERVVSILPKEVVKSKFSLDSDRPTMTFSARMNKDGHILESKISPGTIRNVLFFSPAVMEEVVLGSSSTKTQESLRTVGPDALESSPSRPMLQAHELSDAHKGDLQILHEIGEAHAALLRANGGVDQNFPTKPKTSVSIPATLQENNYNGDPAIRLSTVDRSTTPNTTSSTQGNLVQSFMLVAAQVAARWCSDRGIPVPYRVTPRNPAKENPSEFFLRKVLPSRAEKGVASPEITSEYLGLIGSVLPSITPGPHAAVGVDMMVRCTSPLRRVTDLIVHWQIGATLLEEDRLGQSLVGNTKDDFLPFKKERFEKLLPHLASRETLIKYGKNEGDRHWLCYFLLRAWQFKETELPATFPFLVRNVDVEARKVFGVLTDFSARARCSIPDGMNLEEIQAGGKLEVELEDVNVYSRKIQVKSIRQLEVLESV